MKNLREFRVYPAIDLIQGHCVRLQRGDFGAIQIYPMDPKEIIDDYEKQGAQFLHLVDLDGAKKGLPVQSEMIGQLVRDRKMKVQVGGGLRTEQDLELVFSMGVNQAVLGSRAVQDPNWLRTMGNKFGQDRFVIALDFKPDAAGKTHLFSDGWQVESAKDFFKVLEAQIEDGFKSFLCSDISRDGMLEGPNVEFYRQLMEKYPQIQVQASGGVSSLEDITRLRETGVTSVVVGKSLLNGKFTMAEALKF